ncbi:MAG: hypothetical protein ACTHOC_02450 [Luteimonas sp.]
MGSEIVFLFGPLCLIEIFVLGCLASTPRFRIIAFLCAAVSAFVSFNTVELVPDYSFWTQAGFYGFAFIATSIIALPAMLGVDAWLKWRSKN